MKKTLILTIILSIIVLIIAGCSSDDGGTATGNAKPALKQATLNNSTNFTGTNNSVSESSNKNEEDLANSYNTAKIKKFTFTGVNFKFMLDDVESPDITVKEGDAVRIKFTAAQGFHDWGVKEFDASTKRVSAGESTFVEFVANKKGTFEYYCSVGEHRIIGMKGNIIVE